LDRANVIVGLVFILISVLAPLLQLSLLYPNMPVDNLKTEADARWVEQSTFLSDPGYEVIDQTLNNSIRDTDLEFTVDGNPRGRSHPEFGSGYGPEVVIDGYVRNRPSEGYNPFWAFYPDYYPAELLIFNSRRVLHRYNWVCVVPRWEQQSAYSIEVLTECDDELRNCRAFPVVPMHYQGGRPVAYYFYQDKPGVGLRLVLMDSKAAKNNDWWTPIYEVAAGAEESDIQ